MRECRGTALSVWSGAGRAHEAVYDGDDPRVRPRIRPGLGKEIDTWIKNARTDPATAQGMLLMFTAFDTSPANVARQRHFLISEVGVPPDFLSPTGTHDAD